MGTKMTETVKRITVTALLCAISYVLMLVVHLSIIPAAAFLTYDPKDVMIVIGGLLYGPLTALVSGIFVPLLEMLTISSTGPVGFLMNALSTLAFSMPVVLIYHKRRKFKTAVVGLCAGTVMTVVAMLLWNIIVTPGYMHVPRNVVISMIPTAFLPFNLIKAVLNAAAVMLLYKPVTSALRRAGIIPKKEQSGEKKPGFTLAVTITSLLIIAALAVLIILINK